MVCRNSRFWEYQASNVFWKLQWDDRTVVLWTAFWSKQFCWIPKKLNGSLPNNELPPFGLRNLKNSLFYRCRNQTPQWSDGLSGASCSLVQAFYTLVSPLSGSDPLQAAGAKIQPKVGLACFSQGSSVGWSISLYTKRLWVWWLQVWFLVGAHMGMTEGCFSLSLSLSQNQ